MTTHELVDLTYLKNPGSLTPAYLLRLFLSAYFTYVEYLENAFLELDDYERQKRYKKWCSCVTKLLDYFSKESRVRIHNGLIFCKFSYESLKIPFDLSYVNPELIIICNDSTGTCCHTYVDLCENFWSKHSGPSKFNISRYHFKIDKRAMFIAEKIWKLQLLEKAVKI